jgi:hypothetical protein
LRQSRAFNNPAGDEPRSATHLQTKSGMKSEHKFFQEYSFLSPTSSLQSESDKKNCLSTHNGINLVIVSSHIPPFGPRSFYPEKKRKHELQPTQARNRYAARNLKKN